MKKYRKALPVFNHYAALAAILGAGFSLFAYFTFDKEAQASVILFTAVMYILWGIAHHKLMHFLTREIVLEYVLVAAIGSLVILSMVGY